MIKNSLLDNKHLLIIIPDKIDSSEYILELIKKMDSDKKICYVTLYKSRDFLFNKVSENGLNTERFYFVDCVSSYIKEPKPVENTYFVSAPYELQKIGKGINLAIEKGYSFVVFDSISSLLNYGLYVPAGIDLLKNFIDSFLDALEENKGGMVFLCDAQDKENLLVQESLHLFGEVIEAE
jgi:hypothetical protein